MRPNPPSSGQAPAGFACLRLPLMSNLRPLMTKPRLHAVMMIHSLKVMALMFVFVFVFAFIAQFLPTWLNIVIVFTWVYGLVPRHKRNVVGSRSTRESVDDEHARCATQSGTSGM